MTNQTMLAEFNDGQLYIQLLKENAENKEGNPPPIGDCLYTLVHNLDNESPLTGLSYVEAMILYAGLLAEAVESHAEEAGEYPYTKEQFTALVNFYTQADTPLLNDILASSLSKESSNLK